ncbi:hypothetical protein B7486_12480 [cyanobacterium TDX16]|nr:hypothetical protein B7486_12480 [cyanobacterium TDX16]
MKMSDPRSKTIEELFYQVAERPPLERTPFLDRACGADQRMREEIESLIAADESALEFMERPPLGLRAAAGRCPPTNVQPGHWIGDFEIVRLIGFGGMGAVYESIQQQPRRRVALKIMRGGLPSAAAIRRFEYEAEILGRLSHPGIAQIYSAGVHTESTATVPYFAMEYVDGALTVLEFAARAHFGLKERLDLFARVCDAVHHAHLKGVIHRDLKPTNILVTQGTTEPIVKIIDFGIARLRDDETSGPMLGTRTGDVMGTLAYMSPEQCELGSGAVDACSDVYSLGVVLFELLTGRRPYDVSKQSLGEAVRTIVQDASPRVSRIRPELKGDPDSIVAKAMEKKRERRYQSAAELASDIRRHLAHQPIVARAPSARYQLSRFIARHRAASAMSIAVVVLAIGSAVLLAFQARRLADQRDLAAAAAANAQRARAFLVDTFGMIDPASGGREIKGGEILDRAAARIDPELADEPEVQADVQHALGCIYSRLGQFAEAERLLSASLATYEKLHGPDSRQAANGLYSLACMYSEREDEAMAVPLWERAYSIKQRLLGDDHPGTAYLSNYVALSVAAQGDPACAEELLRHAVDVLERAHPGGSTELAETYANLAGLLRQRGNSPQAEQLYQKALEMNSRVLGPQHWEVANSLTELGNFYLSGSRWIEAERCFREALDMRRDMLGDRHIRVAQSLCALGESLSGQGLISSARESFTEARTILTELLGGEHPQIREVDTRLDELP